MVLSLMPAMAFGVTSLAQTEVIAPSGSVAAAAKTDPTIRPTDNRMNGTDDGQVFTLIITNDGLGFDTPMLYAASSRPTVDYFFYNDKGVWKPIDTDADGSIAILEGMTSEIRNTLRSRELSLKVISEAQGTSRIAFGIEDVSSTKVGAAGMNTAYYAASKTGGDASYIVNNTRYPIEFSAPKAKYITLEHSNGPKYANGVDSYTLTATVLTEARIPASGIEVTFRIVSGTGATLSASRATTNSAGKADVKVYSTRQGGVEVQARVTGIDADPNGNDKTKVFFDSTGIVSIKAESKDNQKKAREDGAASFRISAYDVNGNRVDFNGIDIPSYYYGNVTKPILFIGAATSTAKPSKLELYAEIVSKPSGAALVAGDVYYGVHKNSGNLDIKIPFARLNKDGEYQVKVYLPNGVAVIYTFSVKDLGEVVNLILDYGSDSFAASTYVPEPGVIAEDEDGYSTYTPYGFYNNSKALSISDASFLDGKMMDDGSFKLKEDKSGTLTMTIVDKTLNLVASQTLNVEKAASYLKLTPQYVGAVGGEVPIDIELVDVDGKKVAVGLDAFDASATVVSRPDGAVSSASTVDTSDFSKGKASVKVSSNMEGDVVVRVIITERVGIIYNTGKVNPAYDAKLAADSVAELERYALWEVYWNSNAYKDWEASGSPPPELYKPQPPDNDTEPDPNVAPIPYTTPEYLEAPDTWGGRTYTGAATVSFGVAGPGGGTLIFIIGAPSYVVGSKAFSAESPAFIEGGRTFLGVRDIGTAIGATIEWDQDTETATIAKDTVVVKVTVGADAIVVTKNGVTSESPIDAPAQNKAGRVYLPFRALLEAFGYTVSWDEGTQSIICTI